MNWRNVRLLTVAFVLAAIVFLFFVVAGFLNFYVATAVCVYLLWEFFRHGWEEFPADPPTRWIPMVFGDPANTLERWGLYFFPFKNKNFLYFICVPGTEIALRFNVEMRSPDGGELQIPVFLYYVVDEKNPVQFLRAGKEIGVGEKAKDQLEEILRHWITSPTEGPLKWKEAREATEETVNVILETMFTATVKRISPDVPTEVLIKFFSGRPLGEMEEKEWGRFLGRYRPDENSALSKSVKGRRRLIQDVMNGNITRDDGNKKKDEDEKWHGSPIVSLGIVVTRIGLSNIEPTGATAEGLNKMITADLESQAKDTTAKQFQGELKTTKKILGDAAEARLAVSVRQGLSKEEIDRKHYGADNNLIQALVGLVARVVGRKP